MAIAQSLGFESASLQSVALAARWQETGPDRLRELSDHDLVEMWLNAADPDQPTAAEAAVRDELVRRQIEV